MDPIDYVSLTASPTPVCIICGQRAPHMFFPCGCTHPIHGKCLPIWRQHKGECPGCGAVWMDVSAVATVPAVASISIVESNVRTCCGYECSCIISFLCCIIAVIGLGTVTLLYPIYHRNTKH